MKFLITAAVLLCASMTLSAQIKSCDDLKDEIVKKIESHGAVNPNVTIVDKGQEGDAKVVGTCGGGTKSILYSKSTDAAAPAPKADAKPAPKAAEKPAPKADAKPAAPKAATPAPKAATAPAPKTTTAPASK